jgi:hypothetical protein
LPGLNVGSSAQNIEPVEEMKIAGLRLPFDLKKIRKYQISKKYNQDCG